MKAVVICPFGPNGPMGKDGAMMLIINNAEVERVLTMEMTLEALEESYLALAAGEAVCRPRIDIRIPTSDPARNYQWGTMEGGSTSGYFAIRMKSDVIYETEYNGVITQEKYCSRPALFCGLILLTSIENGEPLAFINDGHLQHMRFGDTPAPIGYPQLATDAEHIDYEARPEQGKFGDGRRSRRKHGNSLPDKRVTLVDLIEGRARGRTSPGQITYSERGNLQGAQF